MTNKYLIKIADMQKIFTRATKQPSSMPIANMGKDLPQTTLPKRTVSTTAHRDVHVKEANAQQEAAAGLFSQIGTGIKNFAVGTGRVAAGTGTAASRVGAILTGKNRNEAALQALRKTNPHITQAEIDRHMAMPDEELRKIISKDAPEHLHNFNREANLRSASRVMAVGGLGTLAYKKYRDSQNQDSSYGQPYYY